MKTLAIATFSILLMGSGFAPALHATPIQGNTGTARFDSGTTVPPTTLALLGAGLFSLVATSKRRKNI